MTGNDPLIGNRRVCFTASILSVFIAKFSVSLTRWTSCEYGWFAENTQLSAPRPTSHRHRVVGVRHQVVERQLADVTGNAIVSCFALKQEIKIATFQTCLRTV